MATFDQLGVDLSIPFSWKLKVLYCDFVTAVGGDDDDDEDDGVAIEQHRKFVAVLLLYSKEYKSDGFYYHLPRITINKYKISII